METFLAKNDSELNEAILIVDDNEDTKITSTEDKYFLIAEKFQDRVRKCFSIDGIMSYVNTTNQKFKHRQIGLIQNVDSAQFIRKIRNFDKLNEQYYEKTHKEIFEELDKKGINSDMYFLDEYDRLILKDNDLM